MTVLVFQSGDTTPPQTWVVFKIPLPLSTLAILAVDLLTDMVPAISLAYEKAELDIMQRPPRSTSDRLVNHRLIFLAYSGRHHPGHGRPLCLLGHYGFLWMVRAGGNSGKFNIVDSTTTRLPGQLLGANPEWEYEHAVMEDSWGQEWTYSQRRTLEFTCNSAYFLAIVQVTKSRLPMITS